MREGPGHGAIAAEFFRFFHKKSTPRHTIENDLIFKKAKTFGVVPSTLLGFLQSLHYTHRLPKTQYTYTVCAEFLSGEPTVEDVIKFIWKSVDDAYLERRMRFQRRHAPTANT